LLECRGFALQSVKMFLNQPNRDSAGDAVFGQERTKIDQIIEVICWDVGNIYDVKKAVVDDWLQESVF
jgi:hypothetical protein